MKNHYASSRDTLNRALVVLTLTFLCASTTLAFSGGDGSPENPYQVATAEHLNAVRNHLEAYFVQTADIDLGVSPWNEGAGWEPIGLGTEAVFSGTYDGSGFTISKLYINRSGQDSIGLFGDSEGAVFKDIHLTDAQITGRHETAGLAGYLYRSSAIECSAAGQITGGGNVGGLIGKSYFGTIEKCHSFGSVGGNGIGVGGLVGNNAYYSLVENSYSTADVSSSSWGVGGLIGYNLSPVNKSYATGNVSGDGRTGGLIGLHSSAAVNFCYSTGNVSGSSFMVGGFVGDNDAIIENSYSHGDVTVSSRIDQVGGFAGQNRGKIYNCYSIGGIVGGDEKIGGFVGDENNGTTSNSYWDIDTSGLITSDSGEGKATHDMMREISYVAWDFENYWAIDEGESYPYFGDFVWARYQVTFVAIDAFDQPIPEAKFYLNHNSRPFDFIVTPENGMVELMLPDYGTYSYDGYFYYQDQHPDLDAFSFYLGSGAFAIAGEDKVIEVRLSLITFTVTDATGNPIEGAEIFIDHPHMAGAFLTNEEGIGVTQAGNANLSYTVSAAGYVTRQEATLEISGQDLGIEVILQPEVSEPFTLSYLNGEGGSLSGTTTQTVEAGQSGSEVTAVPDAGAVFDSWSDGVLTASRTDTDVQAAAVVTATFRSAGGVEIDWYTGHGIARGEGQTWADLDSMDWLGKGMTLQEEFESGTDPNDLQSYFAATPPAVEGTGFSVHFQPSLAERRYTLFRSTDLSEWLPVPDMQNVPGGNGPMVDADPPEGAAFYRIEVLMP